MIVRGSEAHVKQETKKFLNNIGAWHYWPVVRPEGEKTIDCHACHKGQFYGIETKKLGVLEPTKRQADKMEEMRRGGAITLIISMDENYQLVWREIK